MLPFYQDYFGTPYPLPKLDIVAIPVLTANAMENWGLIIFRLVLIIIIDLIHKHSMLKHEKFSEALYIKV